MKRIFDSYKDIIITNLITLFFVTIAYKCFQLETEIIIALLVTGISASMGIRQYKIENDRIFKELFTEFNKMYDSKFNDYLSRIVIKTLKNPEYTLENIESQNEHNDSLQINEINFVIDYLNFCAEEYLWYHKKRIDESVWKSWEEGMIYYFNIKPINEIILKEKSQKNSYYGLFDKIGPRINNWQ